MGIHSLALQMSWFDMLEGDLWMQKVFGRRPDNSAPNRPERVLERKDMRLHEIGAFANCVNEGRNTTNSYPWWSDTDDPVV